jgi:hypothetical protein
MNNKLLQRKIFNKLIQMNRSNLILINISRINNNYKNRIQK